MLHPQSGTQLTISLAQDWVVRPLAETSRSTYLRVSIDVLNLLLKFPVSTNLVVSGAHWTLSGRLKADVQQALHVGSSPQILPVASVLSNRWWCTSSKTARWQGIMVVSRLYRVAQKFATLSCRHANHSAFGRFFPHFRPFSAIPRGIHKIPLFCSWTWGVTWPLSNFFVEYSLRTSLIRKILGAKCHASGDAVDVIAGVTPVTLRIQQLVPLNSSDSCRHQRRPSCTGLRRKVCSTDRVSRHCASCTIKQGSYTATFKRSIQCKKHCYFPLMYWIFNCSIWTTEIQWTSLYSKVDISLCSFLQMELLHVKVSEVQQWYYSHWDMMRPRWKTVLTFSAPTCSHDMEVESVVLAMENALKYYNSTAEKKQHEALFILSDCQAAIDTVINHPFSHFVHPSVDTIRTSLRQLQDMSVTVSLTWILGHTGIEYNEEADQLAKSALARQPDRQTETLTYLACKSLILRKINKRWQEKWDRLPTGRATHERLPTVGRKLVYLRKRCLAISYIRLLFDDTALKVHQHRMKLVDYRECVCGHGIEDHFFFHCHLYSENRKQLMQAIQDIWSNTSAKWVLPQSVTLLLTPSSFSMFTTRQCQDTLEATFDHSWWLLVVTWSQMSTTTSMEELPV